MNREVHVRFWEGVGLRYPALLTYLKAYGSIREAERGISAYFDFYNRVRPHQSLDRLTPDQAYFGTRPLRAAA